MFQTTNHSSIVHFTSFDTFLQDRRSTLHTLHCALHTPDSIRSTPHFTLHFRLHTLHHTLHSTLHSTLHTPHSIHATPHTLHTLHSTLSTLYTPHSALHTLHHCAFSRRRTSWFQAWCVTWLNLRSGFYLILWNDAMTHDWWPMSLSILIYYLYYYFCIYIYIYMCVYIYIYISIYPRYA